MPPPSSPASSTSASTRTPTVQVTPHTRLRSGQLVAVRASGFTPGESLTVIQCAQKGDATGPGDCNLTGMLGVTADARGSVQAQLHVTQGPFGANKIVCSSTQACLVSVTQASLSPTEEADQLISFAP